MSRASSTPGSRARSAAWCTTRHGSRGEGPRGRAGRYRRAPAAAGRAEGPLSGAGDRAPPEGPARTADRPPSRPRRRRPRPDRLANDFARQFPDHTIIEFGRKAGEHGPDVISVDPNGEITFLDSKWRGADTSISPSGRAHQTDKSFRDALKHAEESIPKAVASGRLSPEAAARAQENVDKGNVTIVTAGTGSARNV